MADTVVKHILDSSEALSALRLTSADECPNLEMLLSDADSELESATGHNWAGDTTTDPEAKVAAMLYLISVHEGNELPQSYTYKVMHLDAKAKEMADNV